MPLQVYCPPDGLGLDGLETQSGCRISAEGNIGRVPDTTPLIARNLIPTIECVR